MIDDHNTPTCQRPGEGHLPSPDRQHRLARGAEKVDTAMAWVPSLVGWSEGRRDRRGGLQRPHPRLAIGSCLRRRGQSHHGSEHGGNSSELYVGHRPSVGRGALGGYRSRATVDDRCVVDVLWTAADPAGSACPSRCSTLSSSDSFARIDFARPHFAGTSAGVRLGPTSVTRLVGGRKWAAHR